MAEETGEQKKNDRLARLVEDLETRHAKVSEIIAEIKALALAEPSEGQQVRALLAYWVGAWGAAYAPDRFIVGPNGPKHAGQFKRLLKVLEADEIQRRMIIYLASRDTFIVGTRHSLDLFVKTINSHSQALTLPTRAGTLGRREYECPRCEKTFQSDRAHPACPYCIEPTRST